MRLSTVKVAMKKAIVYLMEKKRFLEITVTDLTREANVGRASFYRIYSSIDQVLDDVLVDVKRGVDVRYPVILSGDEQSIKKIFTLLFEVVKNRTLPFINILPENRHLIFSKFEQVLLPEKSHVFSSFGEKYRIGIQVSSILSIAMIWAYYGYQEPIDDLVNYTYSSLKDVL